MPQRFESAGEKRVAEFLKKKGLDFDYQKPIIIRHDDKISIWYPDFYLNDFNIVIEYFGMVEKFSYVKSMKYKQAIFHKEKINFISIYPEMLQHTDFEEVLWEKIKNIIHHKVEVWKKLDERAEQKELMRKRRYHVGI